MFVNLGSFGENVFTKARKKINKPITIKTDIFGESFSIWPFVVLGRNRKVLDRESLLEHENTHFKRQKGFNLGIFLLKYNDPTNSKYRWKEEKRAFEAEIRNLQSRKLFINYDAYIDTIASKYNKIASIEEIKNFIYGLRDTNPYVGVAIKRY